MKAVLTIQAKAVEKIVRAAENQGLAAHSLCQAAGLGDQLPLDPDERIPFARVVDLYEQAARLTGDDAFGLHVGESVDPVLVDVHPPADAEFLTDRRERVVHRLDHLHRLLPSSSTGHTDIYLTV